MNYFDLHCDTATELYRDRSTLENSHCQISSETIGSFEKYSQVFAVFTDTASTNDKAYSDFFDIVRFFKESNGITFCTVPHDLNNKCHILSVEDARLLNGDISRLQRLYDSGVRILTPLWKGSTCIGGSFDTDEGLTGFGSLAVERCVETGIIPDISHASRRSANEILDIANRYGAPVIASHSNSYEVCPHLRNITDETARKVASSGGIIGICLHAPHIGGGKTIDDAVNHIEHLIGAAGLGSVCLGCDLDGTKELPEDIESQSDVTKLADAMKKRGYSGSDIDKVFYRNAYDFFRNNLGKKRKA